MILVTSEILALITELDEFKGKWQVLNTLAPDHLANLFTHYLDPQHFLVLTIGFAPLSGEPFQPAIPSI